MENGHVTQAFQEQLAGRSRGEQALAILQFTATIEELEAAERKKAVDNAAQQGFEGIGEPKAQEDPDPKENRRRKSGKGGRTAMLLAAAALALIGVIALVTAICIYLGAARL